LELKKEVGMKKLIHLFLFLFFLGSNIYAQIHVPTFKISRLANLKTRISIGNIFNERNCNPQMWDQSNYAHLYACWEGARDSKYFFKSLGASEMRASILSLPASFVGACWKEVYDELIGVRWGNDDFVANGYGLLLGVAQNFTEKQYPKANRLIDDFRRGTELSTWIYDYGWRYTKLTSEQLKFTCCFSSYIFAKILMVVCKKDFGVDNFLASMAGIVIGALINEYAPHSRPHK
jgi:hypothetical protein